MDKPAELGRQCVAVNDPALRNVLESTKGDDCEHAIAELLEDHVYERVDRILAACFRRTGEPAEHCEDVRADVIVKLLDRLRRLVCQPDVMPLENFADYVSVVAFHTFDDFVRRTHPLRAKLKNRVRYALRHDSRFSSWERDDTTFCGFTRWRTDATRGTIDSIRVTIGDDLRAVLADLFEQAGAPLEIDQVVSLIAQATFAREGDTTPVAEPVDQRSAPGTEHEELQYLRRLWSEIRELPEPQRIALLLGARDADGESVTRLLVVAGVATLRELAAAVAMTAQEFAALWPDLPIDDMRIAGMLQLIRQQVINLRRSARDRLGRRLQRPRLGRRQP